MSNRFDLSSIRRQLLPKSRLDPDVALLDLARIKLKLRNRTEGEGWPAEVCTLAEIEYRRFLTLKRLVVSLLIVPNRLMDKFWHFHILDTRNYHADCMVLFGKYLHHYPYFGMRGIKDREELAKAFEITKSIYLEVFDQSMEESPSRAAVILSKNKRIEKTLTDLAFYPD